MGYFCRAALAFHQLGRPSSLSLPQLLKFQSVTSYGMKTVECAGMMIAVILTQLKGCAI